MFWPDSVSCLRCSAVCLRGLSELVELTVANISSQAKGCTSTFNDRVGSVFIKNDRPVCVSAAELFYCYYLVVETLRLEVE